MHQWCHQWLSEKLRNFTVETQNGHVAACHCRRCAHWEHMQKDADAQKKTKTKTDRWTWALWFWLGGGGCINVCILSQAWASMSRSSDTFYFYLSESKQSKGTDAISYQQISTDGPAEKNVLFEQQLNFKRNIEIFNFMKYLIMTVQSTVRNLMRTVSCSSEMISSLTPETFQ